MGLQQEIDYILEVWSSSARTATHKIKKQNRELFEKIQLNAGSTFSEKCKLYVMSLTERPKCKCGNDLKYLDFRRGYTTYCSTKCTASSVEVTNKKASTCLQKYGESHFSKTREYKKKFKSTMISKYGVENPGQIETIKQSRARKKQYTFYESLFNLNDSKPNFTFDEYTHVRDSDLSWICNHCYESFQSNIFSKIPLCPKCFPSGNFGGQSSVEKEVIEFIRSIYSGNLIENSRELIAPKEIDIFFPEFDLAIEVNGVYWHSDRRLEKNYHYEKYKLCENKDINLLMIMDYEWYNKQDVVKNMIKHRIMQSQKKVHARKCVISQISSKMAKEFLNQYHINGFANSTYYLGLFEQEQLVSVLSISKRSRFEKDTAEITRMAFSATVNGALGKFLSYIRKNLDISRIVTYADLRYGSGKVYLNNGFKFLHDTPPGYWYYLNNKIYHRLTWTKGKLVKMGYEANKTEMEIMNEIGALRIYDAGHRKYMMEIH